MPGRSPMGWPGRRGSPLKPFARGSEEGSNSASARGPEKAARRSLPGDAAARRVGESLCASSVVREAAEPAKNRPPAAPRRRLGKGSPAKAARRGLPGGAAVRGWKSNRSQSGTCGGVPVCGPARVRARRQPPAPTPSAAARQGAHGRGPWSGFLGALPRKNRTAVAHGADPSGRSPAKIARRAWLLPSPSLSLRPERAGPLRPPLNLHTP